MVFKQPPSRGRGDEWTWKSLFDTSLRRASNRQSACSRTHRCRLMLEYDDVDGFATKHSTQTYRHVGR